MNTIKSICVYCGSSPGANPRFIEAASEFGKILAENDIIEVADLFLAPILGYAAMFPEAQGILADCPNMKRVGAAMTARPSYTKTAAS